jgi:hypothetical protein
MIKITLPLIFIFISTCLQAQKSDVKVRGKIVGSDGGAIPNYVMVVNLKTGVGHFSESDGSFEISVQKEDTIAFASMGYFVNKICFKDSTAKENCILAIKLRKNEYQLKEIVISPDKSFEEIRNNLKKLGVKTNSIRQQRSYVYSPVTFLYEEFSSRERSKRKLAELLDEDERRYVFKDFVRICIKTHLIDLKEEHLEEFIDYFKVTDAFLLSSSDYEILVAIKERYKSFEDSRKIQAPDFRK